MNLYECYHTRNSDWPGLSWRIYGQYSHRLIVRDYKPDDPELKDHCVHLLPVVRVYPCPGRTPASDYVRVLVDDTDYCKSVIS